MSARDSAMALALAHVASACDGALLGLALALCAAHLWAKYLSSASTLRRVRDAPSARLSDLRSLLPPGDEPDGSSPSPSSLGEEAWPLVVVRGRVQTQAAAEAVWPASKAHGAFVSQGTGERAVVVRQTQTCLYNEWRGIFGRSFDLHAVFAKSWKEQRSSSLRTVPFILVEDEVPFILVEDGPWPRSGYVHINLDGSDHPLPLTTVYHHLHPVQSTPYTFFQALFGNGFPIALLDEEKILPVGKEITAVGICKTRGEALEIKSCPKLPCFLTDLTKDEIEADLAFSSRILFWSGIVLGTFSIVILGYAIVRNWWRWKEWRQRRQRNRELRSEVQDQSSVDEESGDVPDGQLCVVCLSRRRRSAFVPCGHLVCCLRCAMIVERDSSPKCPVCRQSIWYSIRVYDS